MGDSVRKACLEANEDDLKLPSLVSPASLSNIIMDCRRESLLVWPVKALSVPRLERGVGHSLGLLDLVD
jgi:hypothetical protein